MSLRSPITLILMIVMLLSGCGGGKVTEYSIEQFLDYRIVAGGSFSHDETKLLFTMDSMETFNAWTVPVAGGKPVTLTDSRKAPVFALSYFPDDDRFLFLSDKSARGNYHLYLMDENGDVTDLTPEKKARAVFYGWTRDRKHMIFGSNKRDPRFTDIYLMNVEKMKPKMIFLNDRGYNFGHLSSNMRYMSFSRYRTEHDSQMYIYDRDTGEMKDISRHTGEVHYQPLEFCSESRYLYYLTNSGSEFRYLRRYDLATGESETVETAEWDIVYSYFSYDGKYRMTGINVNGKTEIRIYDETTGERVEIPEAPTGEISNVGFSRSGRYMKYSVNSPHSPNDLYVYDFQTGRHTRVTRAMNPEIDMADLVDAVAVRYRSFDGEVIPAVLYKPKKIRAGDRVPALVYAHGGPGGQSTFRYKALFQYMANHGYVVLAPNNRGSNGYGKRFLSLDDRKHGRDDLQDLIEGKNWLIKTGYVDPERIGIIGDSYGGFLVLSAMAFHPSEFAVGVDLFGIANWIRTLRDLPSYWENYKDAFYREMGYPDKDEEYLRGISPIYHAERITDPLMVIQGGKDNWVLKVEAEEVVDTVKRGGVDVEYMLFEDEGHGFSGKTNRLKAYRGILEFLDRHLKDTKK
ncbi:MAG: S9 family peptidase [Bacteroidales bacterium]|nr:S9 family peptidase [Candidatus Latescibacterota bacterium]